MNRTVSRLLALVIVSASLVAISGTAQAGNAWSAIDVVVPSFGRTVTTNIQVKFRGSEAANIKNLKFGGGYKPSTKLISHGKGSSSYQTKTGTFNIPNTVPRNENVRVQFWSQYTQIVRVQASGTWRGN